ncbi:MAG: ATP-binding cassette domain-containing protein [Bacteroidales bacterium]|jgi:ABC-type multidrug transport system ATPase subunit|nr:ATP-binding cassette domain-containing protein [Bacteroidales bacterium]
MHIDYVRRLLHISTNNPNFKLVYEGIIDALMKMFALMIIHSKLHASMDQAKIAVKSYLKIRYNANLANKYYQIFDGYCQHFLSYETKEEEKQEASRLFKEVCDEINSQYNFQIKVNLLLSLLKFINPDKEDINEEIAFLDKLSTHLKLEKKTYNSLKNFVVYGVERVKDKSFIRIIKGTKDNLIPEVKYIINPDQLVEIQLLWLERANLLLVKYFGGRNMYISGHKVKQNSVYVFPSGSMLKTSRIQPIYQSDIMSSFIQKEGQARIVYTAENVEYRFNRDQIGLHRLNFRETSGRFVGILGGSGVGKTTLINVLNGNLKPSSGTIKINGKNLHEKHEELEGIIGYVPQDDLLIEELTVYQNLYYNAKLCFGDMSEEDIEEKIDASLLDFDLVEARDLAVGNPLKKVLSGGQRKRLNIALELMREPLVLLADEPTSGLSSMDSEKVVSLLKRQCLQGSLVIANIHQPSSDIYKQFDRVIVMDKGGRVVYSGNPLDAITYFKEEANYINPEETDCPTCGNVKAEQPLGILEARMVSPTGRFIRQRKVSPQKWFGLYTKNIEPKIKEDIKKKTHLEDIPENAFKTPNRYNQFKTFFKRDLLAKLTNAQYLLIAALQAPILALIFALFAKTKVQGEYIFMQNSNLPSYLFMSVVVALLIGMTISAEEIFKDRLILKREAFLNLSRSAYLTAKISISFIISALQMLLYVLIANSILEIRGMTFYFWVTLFSTACFANILTLNLSAGLKSIVAIYILIPLMLIPQLLFSGLIVDFQNMNSRGNPAFTPAISDAMAARWAYEAIAVEQYKNNAFHKYTFDEKLERESTGFTLYYRIPEIENIIYTLKEAIKEGKKKNEGYYMLLRNEMNTLYKKESAFSYINSAMADSDFKEVKIKLKEIKNTYSEIHQKAIDIHKAAIIKRDASYGSKEVIQQKRQNYVNEQLEETLTGRYFKQRLIYYDHHIVQIDNPVFHTTKSNFGRSHFYAPYKMVLGHRVEVLVYNLSIIWLMILALGLLLYTDMIRKSLDKIDNLRLARLTRNQLLRDKKLSRNLKKNESKSKRKKTHKDAKHN